MNATARQPIPVLRDVASDHAEQLIALFDALFDALLALPRAHVTLYADEYPESELALRLWCSAHTIRLREYTTPHGRGLDATREDCTAIVTIRVPLEEPLWSPAQGTVQS